MTTFWLDLFGTDDALLSTIQLVPAYPHLLDENGFGLYDGKDDCVAASGVLDYGVLRRRVEGNEFSTCEVGRAPVTLDADALGIDFSQLDVTAGDTIAVINLVVSDPWL